MSKASSPVIAPRASASAAVGELALPHPATATRSKTTDSPRLSTEMAGISGLQTRRDLGSSEAVAPTSREAGVPMRHRASGALSTLSAWLGTQRERGSAALYRKPAAFLSRSARLEQQLIQQADLPEAMKPGLRRALHKAGVPVIGETLDDLQRFNPSKLNGPMTSLTPGLGSVVSKAKYSDGDGASFEAVFRRPVVQRNFKHRKAALIRLLENSSSACRDKSSHLIDQLLGYQVLPETHFALQEDPNGQPKVGVVMAFVPGSSQKLDRINEDVTGTQDGIELLAERSTLEASSDRMLERAQALGVDDIRFVGDRVELIYDRPQIDLSTPAAKKKLIQLQINDWYARSIDRHKDNYMMPKDPRTQEVLDVKGIDNDISLDKLVVGYLMKDHLRMGYFLGLPPVVDESSARGARNLTAAQIESRLRPYMPARDILGVIQQHNLFLKHIADPAKCTLIPDTDEAWNELEISEKTATYFSRDMGSPRGLRRLQEANAEAAATARPSEAVQPPQEEVRAA